MKRIAIAGFAAALLMSAPSVQAQAPSPDDLSISALDDIELILDHMVAESERLWSFSLQTGYGQQSSPTTKHKAESILSIKAVFEAVSETLGQIFDIGWSDDGFSKLGPGFNVLASGRYKFPESVSIRGARLGLDFSGSRTGNSTRISENGFGATLTNETYQFHASGLVFLPGEFNKVKLPLLGSRRDVFLSAGAGYASGSQVTELFIPPRDFGSINPPTILKASNGTGSFQFGIGGEEYYAPFFSLSWQVLYRSLKIDELKYDDASIASLSPSGDLPIVEGEGEIATAWDPWFPETSLQGSWVADPSDPIQIDFSGINFVLGVRYHF
ncbi:MAG: hypothetical protein HKN20_03105 [Gemmatimonadetes bacterium]|nr:hypothetical protein [Gemmatimonadota bacterium]